MYFLTSIWVLRTPNADRNLNFHCFLFLKTKKCKKVRNLLQNLAKQYCFLSLHQKAGRRFYSKQKHLFTCFLLWKGAQKFLKIYISTSFWRAQHPNIQQFMTGFLVSPIKEYQAIQRCLLIFATLNQVWSLVRVRLKFNKVQSTFGSFKL